MEEKFNPGDVVKLKSGGPNITVDSYVRAFCDTTDQIRQTVCKCIWFANNERKEGYFSQDTLLKVDFVKTLYSDGIPS